MAEPLRVLEFLRRQLDGSLPSDARTDLRYPTAISRLLDLRIVAVDEGRASIALDADCERHGNQQGTVHGGLLAELADAAIGTAHSTLLLPGESFTSIDLRISFFRPVWRARLTATARPVRAGRTVSHYECEITRDDGKPVALAGGTVLTLRGAAARGR